MQIDFIVTRVYDSLRSGVGNWLSTFLFFPPSLYMAACMEVSAPNVCFFILKHIQIWLFLIRGVKFVSRACVQFKVNAVFLLRATGWLRTKI